MVRNADLPDARMVILYPIALGLIVIVFAVGLALPHHKTPALTPPQSSGTLQSSGAVQTGSGTSTDSHSSGVSTIPTTAASTPASTTPTTSTTPSTPPASSVQMRDVSGTTVGVPQAAVTLVSAAASNELGSTPSSYVVLSSSPTKYVVSATGTTAGGFGQVVVTVSSQPGGSWQVVPSG
jgi:cytoskeletal protein RodZ